METIVRGTTPTIVFTFSDIDIGDIESFYAVIRQCGSTLLTIGIDDERVEMWDGNIYILLKQEDTLLLNPSLFGTIVLDWVLYDGMRGRSKECQFSVDNPAVNVVIGETESEDE